MSLLSGLTETAIILVFVALMVYGGYEGMALRRCWEREQKWPKGWYNKMIARYSPFTQMEILFSPYIPDEAKFHRKRMWLSYLCMLAIVAAGSLYFAIKHWLVSAAPG